MTAARLSPNTEAILLLTAPLIVGSGQPQADLLTPSQYNRLRRHLHKMEFEPADLTAPNRADVLRSCEQIIETARLEMLLARGFLLAQALERWHSRAVWVISRADPEYPERMKERLKDEAPAILYGCGEITALSAGGLAVVGSRHIDDALVQYTRNIGALTARSRSTVVSGGARGIDQAAMHGALDAGGRAVGVLADGLEKAVVNRYNRDMMLAGQLTLASPYDPAAGFNVGNAMRRNKLIYSLADASLVVSSDVNKGGTWTGAVEQLDKLRSTAVFVRSEGPRSAGLDALAQRGARPWPNPQNSDELMAVLREDPSVVREEQPGLPFGVAEADVNPAAEADLVQSPDAASAVQAAPEDISTGPTVSETLSENDIIPTELRERYSHPLIELVDAVRDLVRNLLASPTTSEEVAASLNVSNAEAVEWLERFVAEGAIEHLRGKVPNANEPDPRGRG